MSLVDHINLRDMGAVIERRADPMVATSDGGGKRQKSARLAEECLWISVGTFRLRRKGQWRRAGVLEWRGERSGRVTGVARYRINGCSGAEPAYKLPENLTGEPVLSLASAGWGQTVQFRSSAVTFGRRYYFECECGRNCAKLFLPCGESRFACLRCHGLRHQSQRHECDWFYRPLAASTGIKKRLLRQYFHAIGHSVLGSECG
jgi:hypothetical protein